MQATQVFIETYGCQMNMVDSELVSSILNDSNLQVTPTLSHAQVALLNTCSVRENANNNIGGQCHAWNNVLHVTY